MEYIFEDFIAGFIQEKFSNEWTIVPQESKEHLATNASNEKVFRMRHDIFMTRIDDKKRVIIDTKYKLRNKTFDKGDPKKKGIDQVDLYQMISYAFRRKCTDVILFYPNISEIGESKEIEPDEFKITSGFDNSQFISITAYEIPFWSATKDFNLNGLRDKLESILKKIFAKF